jgi:hypothetical protein
MNSKASPAIAGIAIVVGIVIIVLLGYKFLGPKPMPKDTRGSSGAPSSSGADAMHSGAPQRTGSPGGSGGSPTGSPGGGGQ